MLVICNTDQATWVVVPGQAEAKPVKPNGVGGWTPAGDPVPVVRTDDGGPKWVDEWPCGDHAARLETPAYDLMPCSYEAGSSGLCDKASPRPIGNPLRFEGACLCCGHQGSHLVYRDPAFELPMCQRHRAGA